jgi:cytochrome c553
MDRAPGAINPKHGLFAALAAGGSCIRHVISMSAILCAASMSSTAFAGPDYLGVLPPKVSGVPDVVKTVCSSCHGIDGNSIAPTFPDLAGQNYNYLLKELEDFRSGARKAAVMSQMINSIPKAPGDLNLKNIAAYFSEQKLKANSGPEAKPPKKLVEQGYQLYVQGLSKITPFLITKQEVPACDACHSANGMGNAPMAIPRLAGQRTSYIETELQRFTSGARHNAPNSIMAAIAAPLSATQMKAVAAYVSAMDPSLVPGSGPKTYKAYVGNLKNQPIPAVRASALAGGGSK